MKFQSLLRSILIASVCLGLFGTGLLRAEESAGAPEGKTVPPRLVDLGADRCIPCKMMAPILAQLAKDYAGQLDVVFIDVWKNKEEGERYGIRVIPTQIFFDTEGQERFRHEGFMSKAQILAKWKELGVELKAPDQQQKS